MKKLLLFLALFCFTCPAIGQGWTPENYRELQWTCVGPNRGGRSIACAGSRTRPNEYYFGATGGGLWKTTDGGATWNCVSDGFFKTSSVGAVAVSDSNPDVVYAGMGERDIRGNIAEGDGVYKSTDAGKTWTHVGLANCRTIARIVIHPQNPDIVYVAALGHIFGPHPDRGVYKSTDGGRTWAKILYSSDRAGAVHISMDPKDPNVLFAATWDAWRTPYTMNSGGPGSKIFKTTDAGRSWTDITRNPGLPSGVIGKVGISVSGADSKRVYAIVEAIDGGIFRSDDAGATWTRVNDDNNWRQRAWYYTHVHADPKDVDKLYVLNVGMGRSTDGGKTFGRVGTPHSDNHDLWIDPDNPNRMIEANDGGAAVSTNGGSSWTRQNYPTAQLYHVVADNAIPYRIYGAQQDNSAVMLRQNETDTTEKRNFEGTAGGESGYIAVKPDDPEMIYGGNYSGVIEALDNRTRRSWRVDPWPENPMGHGAKDLTQRFQWTFPIVFSPNDPNVLYASSQYLLKTTNGGQSWQRISPDLTRNDKSKMESSGGPITKDNTSIEYYGTIFTLAESPLRKGQIWTGSDDGLVFLTQNGGGSWANVTPRDMPEWLRCSMIEASPHASGTAYLAANNYQNDDLAPYIYRTHDFGRTWKKIVAGIPDGSFVRVCREDPRRKGLLYAGTETGVFVSFDDGEHWQSLQQNLPVVSVHDLVVKDDDIVVATHGRSFWILRNTGKLANLTGGSLAGPTLYPPLPRPKLGRSSTARVDYYLPANATSVELVFTDATGVQVGSVRGATEAGFRTVNAPLSRPGFGTFPGMVLWAGSSRPVPVPPGDYTVTMKVDGRVQTLPLRLLKDPRSRFSDADLQEQYAFSLRIVDRINEANGSVLRMRDLRSQIDRAMESPKADASLRAQAEALKSRLLEIEGEVHQYRSRSGQDPLNYPVKLNDQLSGVLEFVQSSEGKPPKQAYDVYDMLSRRLGDQLEALKKLEAKELATFNSALKAKAIEPITPKTPPLQQGGGRRGGFEEEGS